MEDFPDTYLDCVNNSVGATVVEEGQGSRNEIANKTQCRLAQGSPEICSECATNSINLRTVRKIQVQVRKKRTKKVIQDKVKELVNKNIDLRQPRIILEKLRN
ncbi:uncharacterized protein LOC143363315 [Halictus rubicundus]|uniref:uncharacterized protein LOC143360287 n=1 Tax=Halictus rubicundus TaxID=77578 RepID=UPI0040375CDA